MLTTHLASWLVSRALKGRTLTATFTEAPAIASVTPALLSCRTGKKRVVRAPGRIQDNASLLLESMSTHFIPASHPCPQGLLYSCSSGLPPKCQSRKYSRFSPQTRSQFVETWVITPELPGVLAPDQRCCISSGCHRPSHGKPHPTLGAWPHQHSCKGKPRLWGKRSQEAPAAPKVCLGLCVSGAGDTEMLGK